MKGKVNNMDMRIEKWAGHNIRFVDVNGEWYAVLKDVCDALDLRVDGVTPRLTNDMLTEIKIAKDSIHPNNNGVNSNRGAKSFKMIAVNELGIYEVLFASRKPEAVQLRRWTATVLKRLRTHIGLQGYEVMRMTEKDIQDDIDHFLDTIFYDEETGKLMMSVTVAGGDVDQIEFEDQDLFKV